MLVDAPALFEKTWPTAGQPNEPPRCRMCARPASQNTTHGGYNNYCSGSQGCTNRQRICQRCSATFNLGVDGAGTKYCSAECKKIGYRPDRAESSTRPRCRWCGTAATDHVQRRTNNIWPYICGPCLHPIRHVIHILKNHHVTHDRAQRLAQDPGCEICGTDLLTKVRERSHGQPKVLLVVDHDHGCCPVSTASCGRCVRGLICRHCNTAAGLLADEPDRAHALGHYLDAWSTQRLSS